MANPKAQAYGVDFGTMFYQTARVDPSDENKYIFGIFRDSFVEMDGTDEMEEHLKRNNWQYMKHGNKFYIIGEDSISVANMFPGIQLRRPLQNGVLNQGEEQKSLILTEMVRRTIGQAPTSDSVVCTCVSSESVDDAVDGKFHQGRLQGILKSLGWQSTVIEEGYAVITNENPIMEIDGQKLDLTGIGISFGAGRVNCVAALRGLPIKGLKMSVARSGDWIDARVAEATGKPLAQVTKIKEKKLDFTNLDMDDDVIFALDTYYGEMIRYVFSKFSDRFNRQKPPFEAPVEVVVAGGTSMPKGFCQKLEEVVGELDLPFEIKAIRHASDPRNSVVAGCLAHALSYQYNLQHKKDKDLEASLG